MKFLKYLYTCLLLVLTNTMLMAQQSTSALENAMFANGKINVVYVVLSIVLTGLIGYALYVYTNIKKYKKLTEE